MKGLEVTEMSLNEVLSLDATGRIDSAFFSKEQNKIRKLAVDWIELGKECSAIVCGPFGSTILDSNYVQQGIPMIRPFNLRQMRSDSGEIVYLEDIFVKKQSLKIFHKGDLMFARVGNVGCSILAQDRATISPNIIAATLSSKRLNPFFAAVFFNTPYGRLQMEGAMKVVAQPTISTEIIRNLRIPSFSQAFQSAIESLWRKSETLLLQSRCAYSTAEKILMQALGLENWQPANPLTYTLCACEVFLTKRFDAEFHQPRYDAVRSHLKSIHPTKSLADLGIVSKGSSVPYSENGTVSIIRSGDLVDISDDERFLKASAEEKIFKLVRGDVLISSIGFGSIGKIQTFDKDGNYGTVSEVTVVRQQKIKSDYLTMFLRSWLGQIQIEQKITGATGQLHLYPKDVALIEIPIIAHKAQSQIADRVQSSFACRAESKRLLEATRQAVETAIEHGENDGLDTLEGVL